MTYKKTTYKKKKIVNKPKIYFKGGSRLKNWCMARVLTFLIRYFSNYYTLYRSDLAARAAPLDPRLIFIIKMIKTDVLTAILRSSSVQLKIYIQINIQSCVYIFSYTDDDDEDLHKKRSKYNLSKILLYEWPWNILNSVNIITYFNFGMIAHPYNTKLLWRN